MKMSLTLTVSLVTLLFSCGEKGLDLSAVTKDKGKKITTGEQSDAIKYGEGQKDADKNIKRKGGGPRAEAESLPDVLLKDFNKKTLKDKGSNILYGATLAFTANPQDGTETGVLTFNVPGAQEKILVMETIRPRGASDIKGLPKSWFTDRLKSYVKVPASHLIFSRAHEDIFTTTYNATVRATERNTSDGHARLDITVALEDFGALKEGTMVCIADTVDGNADFENCEKLYAKDAQHRVMLQSVLAPAAAPDSFELQP